MGIIKSKLKMAEDRRSTAATTTTRYCFVIRHGERADRAPETAAEYEGHPDAFLTAKGHQQAAETGSWLKQ